ncbi:hypothetical protein [Muriventricola aceti]|uniref:hypothetical protein n=1 Tax=Muriventricola aceti TaxID=2981773 RepID=UPI003EBE0DF4
MDNVVLIETTWGDQDIAIQIERTEQMTAATYELSNYIKSLPLTTEQNNTLVSLMVKQVQEAERGAFVQGFKWGMEYEKTAPDE